jgi:N-acetylmuramoyl-L-alanine amidase
MKTKKKKERGKLTHSFYSLSEKKYGRHSNGHAIFHLIKYNAIVAICYFAGYLNTPVNGTWMHNNDFLSECIQAILR